MIGWSGCVAVQVPNTIDRVNSSFLKANYLISKNIRRATYYSWSFESFNVLDEYLYLHRLHLDSSFSLHLHPGCLRHYLDYHDCYFAVHYRLELGICDFQKLDVL